MDIVYMRSDNLLQRHSSSIVVIYAFMLFIIDASDHLHGPQSPSEQQRWHNVSVASTLLIYRCSVYILGKKKGSKP